MSNIVTLNFDNPNVSNTFVLDTDEGDTCLLSHPLAERILLRVPKELINTVPANVKDSTERALDFLNKNLGLLNFDLKSELQALAIHYVVNRTFSPSQKRALSQMCGLIATYKLNNDVSLALRLVREHNSLLDDFNQMWYRNFKGLFDGTQPITSKKQRAAIFNMAGFVMSEMGIPSTAN